MSLRALPLELEAVFGVSAEFAANNTINVAMGYSPFFLNFGNHPLVPSVSHAHQVCVKPIGSRANNGGMDEDRPRGSSIQSHRRSKSCQIISGPPRGSRCTSLR